MPANTELEGSKVKVNEKGPFADDTLKQKRELGKEMKSREVTNQPLSQDNTRERETLVLHTLTTITQERETLKV